MGSPKVTLPFGPETMLARVVRLMGEVVDPVVVVAGVGQTLPKLPTTVLVQHDRHPNRGPLEGLAVGLATLGDRVDAAFAAACDVPLLLPAFIRRVIALSEGYDVGVPHIDGFEEPLVAVYSTCVLPEIEALLAADQRRPAYLFDRVRTRRIHTDELRDVDPQLQSLANTNNLAQYQAALERAGLAEE